MTLDFAVSQDRKNAVVDKLWKGLPGLLKGRKVTTLIGTGTLQAGRARRGRRRRRTPARCVTGRNVVLAAGSVPARLPGFEVDGRWVMTSDEFLDLEKLPASVAVDRRRGRRVRVRLAAGRPRVEGDRSSRRSTRSCRGATTTSSASSCASFKKRGIDIVTGVKVESHTPSADGTVTTVKAGEQSWDVEAIVVSVGRRPRTEGLVADGVGVQIDERGFVVADEYQRTGRGRRLGRRRHRGRHAAAGPRRASPRRSSP